MTSVVFLSPRQSNVKPNNVRQSKGKAKKERDMQVKAWDGYARQCKAREVKLGVVKRRQGKGMIGKARKEREGQVR